jgi:HEAT repeat protein
MHNNLVEFLNSLLIIDPKEDSYDISIWPTLSDSDQNIAKSRLIEQATNGNPKALITLGNLQLTETLKIIKAHTNNKDEWVRFCANRALIKLTGVYDGLLDDASSKSETTRFGALLELTKINDVTVENKIIDALYDKDNLVRSKALEALINRHKLEHYG